MSNIQIESDLKDILNKFDQKLDKLSDNFNHKLDSVNERLNKIEVSQATLDGKIEAVDQKLSGKIEALDTKVDQLDKRISNSELTNRGILIGLVVIILGGAAKLFGLMPNP
jgi:predicted nuclease with TOPRIM domain